MATSSDAFQAAVSKHRQGQLAEAEKLCGQILAADAACAKLKAFARAHPEQQPDAQ